MAKLLDRLPRTLHHCMVFVATGLFGFSLNACAAEHSHPATTAPAVGHEVKLSDAVPLSEIQQEGWETNLTDKLSKPLAAETIYFGEIDQFSEDDPDKPIAAMPIIASHGSGDWLAVPLAGEGLTDAGWRYVAAGPAPKEIWAALDTAAGDSRSKFVIVHSTDGGASFSWRVFHKPCKLASFFDFVMDRSGHGRATVSLDSDCGEYKSGLYHYETSDDGKTWSAHPRFEPDVMIHSDPVPDEEQPDEKNGKARTLLKQETSRTGLRRAQSSRVSPVSK